MKRTIVIILSILLIIAIFAYLSVSLAMFKKSTHEEINRLLDEITRQEQIIGLLEQNFRIASRDSAEMRTQLRLPLVKYLFPSQDSGEDETVAESDDTSRFFKALDILIERLETDENRSAADSFFSGRKMQEVLSESELFLKPTKEGYILEHDGHPFYRITIKGRLLYIQDSYQLTEAEKISLTPDAFSEYFKKTYDQVLAESGIRASLEASFLSLQKLPGLETLLKQKNLTAVYPRTAQDSLSIRGGETPVVTVSYLEDSAVFSVNGKRFDSFDEMTAELRSVINGYNNPTSPRVSEQESSILEIKRLAEDAAFTTLLKKRGYRMSFEPREDNDYFYFDIFSQDNTRIGSFAVLKANGIIYLIDSEDIPISSIRAFTEAGDTQKKNPVIDYLLESPSITLDDESITTFLLCGSHENDTDTLMLLAADSVKNTLTLISLPRDLFYHSRKINTIYKKYGPYRLMSELSAMTGLRIDKYVVIDMYAFIDVVNILGGIDVNLEEDLIDPTYKIKENGQWSSLYYEKGKHHLDGIAALRVARSRNYSSDFDRAHRQQLIIAAIADEMKETSIVDIKTYSRLIGTLMTYVDTNMSAFEILSYTNRFRSARLSKNHVIDTSNILYHTYSNIYLLPKSETETETEQQVDENFDKGAWILIPVDDNWNLIPAYINRIINGG